jgi:hypothetical protein
MLVNGFVLKLCAIIEKFFDWYPNNAPTEEFEP